MLPEIARPERPTPAARVPAGDAWLHEMWLEGERALARIDRGAVVLLGEDGDDRTADLWSLAQDLAKLPAERALLDGVVVDAHPGHAYVAFDLLYRDGEDLRRLPLDARKRALAELLAGAPASVHLSRHLVGAGDRMVARGCALGLRAVVSKRRDAPYREGPSRDWLRVPCPARAEPERPLRGSAPGASRVVGTRVGKKNDRAALVCGVKVSHADRLVYPELGVTKEDLARFYVAIADHVVPELRGRPLTLVRCPGGAGAPCAYMRHAKAWGPSVLRRVNIREKTKVGEYLVADTIEAVVGLVQMDIVEIHTWNATVDDLERPDRLVIDLDPAPDVPWERVVGAAKHLRHRLEALDLASFVKTTGGKGLHVVVPLVPSLGWDDCVRFVRGLSERVARADPESFTVNMAKSARGGRIYLDYLRNVRGNTAVAAYTARAKPAATVSMPLAWAELRSRVRPEAFTVETLARRLAGAKAGAEKDPWEAYERSRRPLDPRIVAKMAAG